MLLSDQSIRENFSLQFEKNFSIIAPAGVGKTHAIVERIVNIIKKYSTTIQTNAPRLLVVTYTKKAAQEMSERVRLSLEKQAASLEQIQALDNHFFGTIHSFCYELICEHRLQLKLPNKLDLCEEDHLIWLQYVRSAYYADFIKRYGQFEELLRYVSIFDIYRLLELSSHLGENKPLKGPSLMARPQLNLSPILNYVAENKRVEKGQEREKQKLREWIERLEGRFPMEIPVATAGGDAFKEAWLMAFKPLRDWVGDGILEFAKVITNEFQAYRLQQGLVTYQDMIALTRVLLQQPAIMQKLRERNYAVILDEAQDCDRLQFEILLHLASPVSSVGLWPFDATSSEPEAGRFCMVGDPQQSIYSDRADLKTYQYIHRAFSQSRNGIAGEFHVTFRCDRAILELTNAVFPNILKPNHPEVVQASYVTMEARPDAGKGQVVRLEVNLLQEQAELGEAALSELEQIEAEWLAWWLKQVSPENLRISDWSECAILVPRNEWLKPLAKGLEQLQIPYQVRSKHRNLGHNPAYAWLAGLIAIMVEPANAFEINGVLREIFGLKDGAIADYVHQAKQQLIKTDLHPLQILDPELILLPDTEVGKTLMRLSSIRSQVLNLGLREGIDSLVCETHLLLRLCAIQSYYTDDLSLMLVGLLNLTSQFEKESKTLLDVLEYLRKSYNRPMGEEKVIQGKIQLLTCHSAKGLQWDAVIIPFLCRPISFKDLSYPRLLWPKETVLPPILSIDAQHNFPDYTSLMERMRIQELERLLYVAITRAKHSLIFLDDRKLFATNECSFGDLLQVLLEGVNSAYFTSLANEVSSEVFVPALSEAAVTELTIPATTQIITLSQERYQLALDHARSFPIRITPSALSHAVHSYGDDEEDIGTYAAAKERILREVTTAASGADYGNWWHETLELAPLNQDKGTLSEYLSHALRVSPDPKRAEREFELFLSSELFTRLSQPNAYLRTELPILGKTTPLNIYEGFVDLLAYLPQENTWLIVDWKTDQIYTHDPLSELVKTYSPQLLAYTAVLTPLLKGKIETLLYATRLGQAISCDHLIKNPAN